MRSILLSVVVALLTSANAYAQGAAVAAPAVIEAVQYPAWIERDGKQAIPATPGMRLEDRDQVRTGGNSRILLRMPEGSTVKLGENARYRIDIQQRKGNVYTAAMNVLEGAFRFSTDIFGKYRGRREVRINFPTVTAGIRGTDVWGKSAPDREIVCLIEGTVQVERNLAAPVVLNQPLQFYIAPTGQPADPVGLVSAQQLREWSEETEIQAGQGASRSGGRWKVVLATVGTQAEALDVYDQVRAAGYPAGIMPMQPEGKKVYEVRITQVPGEAEARAIAQAVKGKYLNGEPKIAR